MAEKQKRKPTPKPTRKMTQAEQSERFKETARKLGADESSEAFEYALTNLIGPKPTKDD
jgi:hypothetical protein